MNEKQRPRKVVVSLVHRPESVAPLPSNSGGMGMRSDYWRVAVTDWRALEKMLSTWVGLPA
jgi:hypothetical protein